MKKESHNYSAAATGRKQQREKELSGREKSARGIPSRRGEIVSIVITIELDFIGVITISIPFTFPLCSIVTSSIGSCLVHRGNSAGVDYSLLLILLSETIGLRFMLRLLSIII